MPQSQFMSCYKCLIFSTHVIQSFQATNIWYHFTQSCQVNSCQNVWYSGLLSYIHIMSQMSDNQYSFRKVMSCHKYLIYSTHITQSFHVMSQISDIQYSCQTYMNCHKCLIFSTQVTQSCDFTNVWYSVFMSHSHVMTQISDIHYSWNTVMQSHVTNIW